MQNTISERIADFLKSYPPFYYFPEEDLQKLAAEITIIYKENNSFVFAEGDKPHAYFYIVHKGAIALWKSDEKVIVDICDEGDIFGLRPLMAKEDYLLHAKAQEESILYAIPIEVFTPYAKKNADISAFLIESFASKTENPYSRRYGGALAENFDTDPRLLDLQKIEYNSNLITCTKNELVQNVATIMTANMIGSILVVENDLPIGIITDKDLRNNIATGKHPITASAETIMSTPIVTYPKELTITQAQMAMMKNNISHLVLTDDGTPNTKAVGILSKNDVMTALGTNPAALVKAVKRAKSFEEIRPIRNGTTNLLQGYLDQNIPLTLISKIISEINDACIKQIIMLSLDELAVQPPVDFTWLAMGSQGRSEQLLNTDQDNAILFGDVPEEKLEETRAYFLNLAKLVTKGLNTIGFDYCPADMMASNPKWCLSLQEFKDTTWKWITNPGPDEVLLSSIFYDFNRSYGDKYLVDALNEHIFKSIENQRIFLTHLAAGALQNPSPTGFFRQFLVEQDGEHKDFFDLKMRALMPLIDAARVLILSHKIPSINNTWERYEKLAELEPQNAELFLACSYASKALVKFRTKQGLENNSTGRYINLDKLNKQQKLKLKRTFSTVKDIQELISFRFMTSRVM